jgi:hypothetical protein
MRPGYGGSVSGSRTSSLLAISAVAATLTLSACSGGSGKPRAELSPSPSAQPSDFTASVLVNPTNSATADTTAKYIGFNKAKAAKALRYLRTLKWVKSATYIESKGEIDVVYKKGTTMNEVVDTQTRINQM